LKPISSASFILLSLSPPVRGRGLKLFWMILWKLTLKVAPRAGAWIETNFSFNFCQLGFVAPRAGAWIETSNMAPSFNHFIVAPRAGAWIETYSLDVIDLEKLVAPRAGAWIETNAHAHSLLRSYVAPRAGAWIETFWTGQVSKYRRSRPPCGGVD